MLHQIDSSDFCVPSLAPTGDKNFVNAYKVQNGQLAAVIHQENGLYVCRFHVFVEDDTESDGLYSYFGYDIEVSNLGLIQNKSLDCILEVLKENY